MQDHAAYSERIFNVLLSEERGALLQVPVPIPSGMQAFFDAGLRGEFYIIGQPIANDRRGVLGKDSG